MKALLAVVFILLASQGPLTWSQNPIPTQILVEKLSDEPCGLTEDAISGRVRLTLRQYGFTETKYSNPYFYVRVTSLEIGQQCVGEVTVEISGFTAQDFSEGGVGWVSKAKSRETVLASSSSITTYPRYVFASTVLDSVEARVKKVLGEIQY
jgi:hypothetical protein